MQTAPGAGFGPPAGLASGIAAGTAAVPAPAQPTGPAGVVDTAGAVRVSDQFTKAPPFADKVCPVMKLLSEVTRKAAVAAISAALPSRPIGLLARSLSTAASPNSR